MEYVNIFSEIPWKEIGITVIQTITIFWLVLLGLKMVGRRVFGEMGPQDIIVLLLISESCDLGLTSEKAGYWGSIASVFTILCMGYLTERIPFIRSFFEDRAVTLFKDGQLEQQQMKKFAVEMEDLEKVAREYGLDSYQEFKAIILEGDGSMTGIVQSEFRRPIKRESKQVAG